MNHCRLCGGKVGIKLSLNPTPIANSFPDTAYEGELYPLDLKQCDDCQHVQIGHVVPDSVLYGASYKYDTPAAQIPAMERQAIALRRKYPKARNVLEIGSNNGLFTDALLEAGFQQIVGVDPSGTHPLCWKMPFDTDCAAIVSRRVDGVDLIVANNVLAHIDDLDEVFRGIDACLTENGALVFEVQALLDMAKHGLFDMIYHEHRDYHTLTPLVSFLARHHLAIKEVERIPAHGGSMRVHCGRGKGISIIEPTVDWDAFKNKIAAATYQCIVELNKAAGHVVAFGATAKACTLIHQMGIQDRIDYAADCTPQKVGKYIAGTGIRICSEADMAATAGHKTLLLTAWNYETIIRAKYPECDFIVPFKPTEVKQSLQEPLHV